MRLKVLAVFGTRPEAIKMAPVVHALAARPADFDVVVCATAQHRDMLDQVLDIFHLKPDIDLDLMERDQDLARLTSRVITSMTAVLRDVAPAVVLVQGDTTSAMATALAAFYTRTAVGHVEAGLRTSSIDRPYPEEMNRRVLSRLATLHFAPTESAARALRAEGVPKDTVFVTGNPVIDALQWVDGQPLDAVSQSLIERLGLGTSTRPARRAILVTAHRRESFGDPLRRICRALATIASREDVQVVYPVHPNPNVRREVDALLQGRPRIVLTEPLPYRVLVAVMARSYLVLTDSGGLQEEAPALAKPVLVLRDETERSEGVEAGVAKLVGSDVAAIVDEVNRLLDDATAYRAMATAISPYGDGHAAARIVRVLDERRYDLFQS